LGLFYAFTRDLTARKVVYYAGAEPKKLTGYEYIRYRRFTNWHHACAADFIAGGIAR